MLLARCHFGVKDRNTNRVVAKVMPRVNQTEMDKFLHEFADPDAEVYTDGAKVYKGIPYEHSFVNHSIRRYVDGKVQTNGIESFWASLKRGYMGTYHHMSVQHIQRYVTEFQGRHNIRNKTAVAKLTSVVVGLICKSLLYRDLTTRPPSRSPRLRRSTWSRSPASGRCIGTGDWIGAVRRSSLIRAARVGLARSSPSGNVRWSERGESPLKPDNH